MARLVCLAMGLLAACGSSGRPDPTLDLTVHRADVPGSADPSATPDGSLAPGHRIDVGTADLVLEVLGGPQPHDGLFMPGDVDGDGLGDLVISSEHRSGT